MFGADEAPTYAGFWPRLAALLLDGAVAFPVLLFQSWLMKFPGIHPALAIVPSVAFSLIYSVFLVYRFGGTPGKLLMRLRITNLEGAPVTLSQAFLRNAPDLVLGTLGMVAGAMALRSLGWEQYLALAPVARGQALRTLAPPWGAPVGYLQSFWSWGELIVLLTNERRRALHDFLAGTIVVVGPRPRPTAADPLPFDGTWRNAAPDA